MKNLERIAKLCSTFNNQILQEAGQWRHSVEVWQKHCTVFTISLPTIWDYPILNDQTFASVLAWFHTACVVTWGDNLRLSYSKWSHVCICACLISYCMCQWCGWPGVVFFLNYCVDDSRKHCNAFANPQQMHSYSRLSWVWANAMVLQSCWELLEFIREFLWGCEWSLVAMPDQPHALLSWITIQHRGPCLETYQDAKRQNQRDWGTVA